MKARILVVDDEASMREFLTIALDRMGHQVDAVESGEDALKTFAEKAFDIVLSDIRMPDGMDGVELLAQLKETDPSVQVILMTAYASIETAIKAVQLGAIDYILKPFQVEQIKLRIDRVMEQRKLVSENQYLRRTVREKAAPAGILGESQVIQDLRRTIEKVAPTQSTVLITGESGTGKELVARALHDASTRSEDPFITINCGAIPEGLLESELFGHKKGSFTGAVHDKDGLFKVADNGTIFLDEVGETSPAIQVKLLRVLQEREIVPVGGTTPIQVDVRVITATNSALDERVSAGTFREDLFYRLNVVPIHIPPLRERMEDIVLLANHFLAIYGRDKYQFTESAVEALQNYSWPGNVRELENSVESAVVLSEKEVVDTETLPQKIQKPPAEKLGALPDSLESPTLESIEKAYIHWVLTQTGGVKTAAADILGIDPSTLHRKMDKYGMRVDREAEKSD